MKPLVILLMSVAVLAGVPPDMTLDKKVYTLYEGTNTNEPLATISCTDKDGDKTRVFVQSVSPSSQCSKCFEVLDCAPNECLQYRAGVGTLRYASTQTYVITLACEDNTGLATTDVFQVDIRPNSPPYFSTPDKYRLASISGKAKPGTKITTVDAADDDQDTLTYTMTVDPSTSSSNYIIDPITGDISTTVDMRTECRNDVTLSVSVSDGISTTGPLVISVPITNPNVAPVALNLDTTVMIPEDTPLGKAYTMELIDGNKDPVTYTVTANNPAGAAQFTIDGKNPIIGISSALDYENQPLRQTDLVVTATDGYCSTPPHTLKLRVTDVNEKPTISPEVLSIQVCEGKGEFDPGYKLIDPDVPDTVRWSFNSKTSNTPSRFGINPNTGAIIKLVDYDVDTDPDKPSENTNMAATNKFVVEATDKGGLTATATVSVTLLDCNDNPPKFKIPAYEFSATECTTGGTRVGTVAATDIDSTRQQNNVVYYEGSGGGVLAGTGGEIIVARALPAGSVVTFDVYAWDRGQTPGPLRSVNPTVVSVVFTPCPTTPPPTQAPPVTTTTTTTTTTPKPTTTTKTTTFTKTDADPNLPWIIIAALLGAFMLGLLTYMLWKYGSLCMRACRSCQQLDCGKSCRGRPARPVRTIERPEKEIRREPMKKEERPPSSTPSEEPKEKEPNGPGFLFAFWKEHYKEKSKPKGAPQNTKPEPGDMTYVYPHTYDPADPPLGTEPPAAQPSTDVPKKKCVIQ